MSGKPSTILRKVESEEDRQSYLDEQLERELTYVQEEAEKEDEEFDLS